MKHKQSIMTQAKFKLAKMLKLKFATIDTDQGEILYVDGDIQQGASVYVVTESGDYVQAGDGEYTADGVTYSVMNGVISAISGEENFENAEDVDPADPVSGEVTAEDVNEIVEVVNEILDVIKEQDDEIMELAEEVVMLQDELKRAKGTTNGKPAQTEKFNRKPGRFSFADQKMQKLIENFK